MMKLPVLLAAALVLTVGAPPLSARPAAAPSAVESVRFVPHAAKATKTARTAKPGKTRKAASTRKTRSAQSVAQIRDAAINSTVAGLSPLKRYSTNYGALVAAVKSYWRRNVTKPNASALANTILRHVKPSYRKYAANKVHAGAAEGVASVRLALRRS